MIVTIIIYLIITIVLIPLILYISNIFDNDDKKLVLIMIGINIMICGIISLFVIYEFIKEVLPNKYINNSTYKINDRVYYFSSRYNKVCHGIIIDITTRDIKSKLYYDILCYEPFHNHLSVSYQIFHIQLSATTHTEFQKKIALYKNRFNETNKILK